MSVHIKVQTVPLQLDFEPAFESKVKIHHTAGRFTIKTLSTPEELKQAYLLRYQVFHLEMIGNNNNEGLDYDKFDLLSDHLAISNTKTNELIATCRLNCSLFSNQFYSAQEFQCQSLTNLPMTKIEIGRLCVHPAYRNSILIMLFWQAFAEYMHKTGAEILFGCSSIMTQDPNEAFLIFRYLEEIGKIRRNADFYPHDLYRSEQLEQLLAQPKQKLEQAELDKVKTILPSLSRSYFDIGCYSPCAPAFDKDFRCIDFLTILELNQLKPNIRERMFGKINV